MLSSRWNRLLCFIVRVARLFCDLFVPSVRSQRLSRTQRVDSYSTSNTPITDSKAQTTPGLSRHVRWADKNFLYLVRTSTFEVVLLILVDRRPNMAKPTKPSTTWPCLGMYRKTKSNEIRAPQFEYPLPHSYLCPISEFLPHGKCLVQVRVNDSESGHAGTGWAMIFWVRN